MTARGAVELLARVAGFRGEVREEYGGSARSAGVDWMLADIGHPMIVIRIGYPQTATPSPAPTPRRITETVIERRDWSP